MATYESSINFVRGEQHLTYYTNDPKWVGRLRRRIEQNPEDVEVIQDDPEFGLIVHVPASWFKEPAPKRKGRELTDEEKLAAAQRLAKCRGQVSVDDCADGD